MKTGVELANERPDYPDRGNLATWRQINKIAGLMNQLGWLIDDREKYWKEIVKKDPLKLTKREASKVINDLLDRLYKGKTEV